MAAIIVAVAVLSAARRGQHTPRFIVADCFCVASGETRKFASGQRAHSSVCFRVHFLLESVVTTGISLVENLGMSKKTNDRYPTTWVTVRPTRPTDDAGPVLRSVSLSVRPGHEVFKVCDLGVGDVGEDNGEPGLRIDIVELGGLDEGVGDGRGLTAAG